MELFPVPAPVSSSCGQKRGGSRRWRPTACCGPGTVGYQCRGPIGDTHRCYYTVVTQPQPVSDNLFPFHLNVFR